MSKGRPAQTWRAVKGREQTLPPRMAAVIDGAINLNSENKQLRAQIAACEGQLEATSLELYACQEKLAAKDAEIERLRRDLSAQVENDEQLAMQNVKTRWLLGQIITHLPTNRDWLDPDVESEARAAMKVEADDA